MKIKLEPTKDLLDLDESERIRWAVDLETGEYEQGRCGLLKYGQYCCLGVWEWINGHEDSEIKGLTLPDTLKNPTRISGKLPQHIYAASSSDGKFLLYQLNDGFVVNEKYFRLNFNQIAQLLRGNSIEIKSSRGSS